MTKELKVFYDRKNDILSLSKEGIEDGFIEIHAGVHIEYNDKKEFIGIEILNASRILKDVVKPIQNNSQHIMR